MITQNRNKLFSGKQVFVITAIVMIALLNACSVEQYIPDDKRLYTGASLTIENDSVIDDPKALKAVLTGVLSPKPNTQILGMRPGLYFYYKNQKDKPGFINRFLYKNLGEEPVYQTDVEPLQIEELLLNRLNNRGFFYSTTTSEFVEQEKFASVDYTVSIRKPFTLASYQVDTVTSPILSEIQESVAASKLDSSMRFDLSALKMERNRIDRDLKLAGYYNFNPGFLIFQADTNQYDTKRFDLYAKLKKEVPTKSKIPYRISSINIYPNHDLEADSSQLDTVRHEGMNFIRNKEFFKPKYLEPFVTLAEGQLYSPDRSSNTARRLSTIGSYKFVNIQYKEIDTSASDSLGNLAAEIYLSPLNRRAVRAQLQAVTKSNNFAGPTLALTFSNRNLFKGGETLNITGSAGYEVQVGGGSDRRGLSSLELGLEGELIFPRVIAPFKINTDFFEYSIPKTRTALSFDYLNRSQLYSLLSGTAAFGYIWDANRYITHDIKPISVNYTQLSNTTEAFEEILDENPFLERSFEQQFISGLIYSFTYNGMVDTDETHQFYFNGTFDTAGNSISLLSSEREGTEGDTFLGQEFAQYAKGDVDVRYHFNFGKDQKIATRLFAGYGLPYGNSDVVPYVKQYFAGGPYSVRAFNIRSLGPGTYEPEGQNNQSFFDQTGNIRLEANLEYRFPIVGFFKGAVFADAGNVWNSDENPATPGGKFSSAFLKELGIGAGVGLRVDVQGFVIRFDLAAPIHDPSKPQNERLNFNLGAPVFNFAIGYPF